MFNQMNSTKKVFYNLLFIITSFGLSIFCSSPDISESLKPQLQSSMTLLMLATNAGDLETVKHLRDTVVNINRQDKQGRTALFIAAQHGYAQIIKELLVRKDIDINLADNDGMAPLQIAVTNGHTKAVNALLDACKNIRLSSMSPKSDEFDISYVLNRNSYQALLDSDKKKYSTLEQRDKKLQLTPLARAAQSGNKHIIKLLLEAGANPTTQVPSGNASVTVASLYKGNDVELLILIMHKILSFNNQGIKFINALEQKNRKIAIEIFKAGMYVNAKDLHDNTPLHWAAKFGDKEMAKMLIDAKADVNAKEEFDYTPLHDSIRSGNIDVVQLLIDNKADINAKSKIKVFETPIDLAAALKCKEIVDLLIKNKAELNTKKN